MQSWTLSYAIYTADVWWIFSFQASSSRHLNALMDGALMTSLGNEFQLLIVLCENHFIRVALCAFVRRILCSWPRVLLDGIRVNSSRASSRTKPFMIL